MTTITQWREGAPPEGVSCAWLRTEEPYPDHDPQVGAVLAVLDDGALLIVQRNVLKIHEAEMGRALRLRVVGPHLFF